MCDVNSVKCCRYIQHIRLRLIKLFIGHSRALSFEQHSEATSIIRYAIKLIYQTLNVELQSFPKRMIRYQIDQTGVISQSYNKELSQTVFLFSEKKLFKKSFQLKTYNGVCLLVKLLNKQIK